MDMSTEPFRISRRGFLRTAVALSAPVALAWGAGRGLPLFIANAEAQGLPLTPECSDADDVTPAQTEGPYFTRNSPETSSLLETGMAGTRLVVLGSVLSSGCQPVSGALLDFWQADDRGQYDNVGFRLRGHQFTDSEGRYRLETIVPGLYPGRTRHIHVKVQAPGGRILTTQLYFQGEPGNQRDGIFMPQLAMSLQDDDAGSKSAQFNFVVATAL
jgi:protocatechuate 3,4-dioxygenase beta subunit